MHKLNRMSWPGNRKPSSKWQPVWLFLQYFPQYERSSLWVCIKYMYNGSKLWKFVQGIIFGFFVTTLWIQNCGVKKRAAKKRIFSFSSKEIMQHQIRGLPWKTWQLSARWCLDLQPRSWKRTVRKLPCDRKDLSAIDTRSRKVLLEDQVKDFSWSKNQEKPIPFEWKPITISFHKIFPISILVFRNYRHALIIGELDCYRNVSLTGRWRTR